MLHKRLQENIHITMEKMQRENKIIGGSVVCCNDHRFLVSVAGKIKKRFTKMYLYEGTDAVKLSVRCLKCGKQIEIFDGSTDWDESLAKQRVTDAVLREVPCIRCKQNDYSVHMRYEYSNAEELSALSHTEEEHAFSWVWCTIVCNRCGARYRNFISIETA